jgi:hypothetical protein
MGQGRALPVNCKRPQKHDPRQGANYQTSPNAGGMLGLQAEAAHGETARGIQRLRTVILVFQFGIGNRDRFKRRLAAVVLHALAHRRYNPGTPRTRICNTIQASRIVKN